MKDVAESFNRLTHVYGEKANENEIKKVLDQVRLMSNLTKEQWAKAVKWLVDMPKQLAIVKALPIEQEEDYVIFLQLKSWYVIYIFLWLINFMVFGWVFYIFALVV